jgi:flagellar M-ring protein FliF
MGVIGLELENIEIIDHNSHIIFSGRINSTDNAINTRILYEQQMRALYERNVRNVASPFWDEARIGTNVVFDHSQTMRDVTEFTSPAGAEAGSGYMDMHNLIRASGTGVDTANQIGMTANDLVNYPTGVAESSSYRYLEEASNFIYNQARTIIEENGGGRILLPETSVSVTGVRYRTFSESNFNAGYYNHHPLYEEDMSWGQFKVLVEESDNLVYTNPEIERVIQAATGAGIVVVATIEIPRWDDLPVRAVPLTEIVVFSTMFLLFLLLAYMVLHRTKPVVVGEIEPELSVEDLLVSSQIDEEKEIEMQEEERLREIKMQQDSEVKQLIEKFVDSRPESAAQLLRNWLNEDWE